MRLHHVAYAVSDIGGGIEGFETLGFAPVGGTVEDGGRHCLIQFMGDGQGSLVELVAPTDGQSPVAREVAKARGKPHPYHICLEVGDIDGEVARLTERGLRPVTGIEPAPAIGNRRVCHLYGREVGLIELVGT